MNAKSIIEYVRGRLAAGAWMQQLSFIPVAMALAVAVLPFTLEPQPGLPVAAQAGADDLATATPADTNLVKAAASASSSLSARAVLPDDPRYTVVADYMARRFLVSRQVVLDLVKTAHGVGRQYNVDPTLLVAVMAVESSFNPIAESVAGAKGLMQIIPQYHLEKFVEFGGEQAIFEPRTNIAVGAKIIREYLQASSGNLFTAMQTYAGALPDRDASYTHKVLNEKDRLDAIMGLPKTDRSGYVAQSSVQPAPGGRVQMTIPPVPGVVAPSAPPSAPPSTATPTEPTAGLPVKIAAAPRAE